MQVLSQGLLCWTLAPSLFTCSFSCRKNINCIDPETTTSITCLWKFIFSLFLSFLTYCIKVVLTSKNYTNQIKQSLTNREREHEHKHKEKKVLRNIKRYALQIRLHSKVSDTESGGCLSKLVWCLTLKPMQFLDTSKDMLCVHQKYIYITGLLHLYGGNANETTL